MNNSFLQVVGALTLSVIALGVSGCTSSYGGAVPTPYGPGRTAVVNAWAIENSRATTDPASTAAPLVAGVITDSTLDSDKDFTPKGNYYHDPPRIKTELDFGDGSGWQDITALIASFDYNWNDGVDPAGTVQHTYTAPGDYTIDARVTYWDGEVVYAHDSKQHVIVHVTDPQAGAS